MNVIIWTSNNDRGTFQCLGNSSKLSMEFVSNGFIAQEWATFFGGKDQMDINCGERLGHDFGTVVATPLGLTDYLGG